MDNGNNCICSIRGRQDRLSRYRSEVSSIFHSACQMGNKIFSFADARKYARRRMPRMTFDYIDGSALDERANALNVESIDAIRLMAEELL